MGNFTGKQEAVGVRFSKMQALGNDFVVLNGYAALPVPEEQLPDLAVALCDRHFGIGADGLIVAAPSPSADARMLFYNPDGTPDRCGNGLRCFGRFLHDEGITAKTDLVIDTYGGPVALNVQVTDGIVGDVRVDLGPPVLEPERIPLAVEDRRDGMDIELEVAGLPLRTDVISTGTPHAVIPVEALPDEATFQNVSPLIETHPLFPEKTSVMWTHFTAPDQAEVRIWERATGETLGCGTGAAAVAVVARLRGLSAGPVCVASRGGSVWAEWDGASSVTLTGPAELVFVGEW
jgi:diaminopimelate epimerase